MTDLELLLARVGHYAGHGIDHLDRPFHGELELAPLLGNRGIHLTFRTVGIDGTPYHEERGWIAPDGQGRTAMWRIHTESAGVERYDRRHGAAVAGARSTLVFGIGDRGAGDQHRIEVALDLWPDGEVTFRTGAATPGEAFGPRSSVRLSREVED